MGSAIHAATPSLAPARRHVPPTRLLTATNTVGLVAIPSSVCSRTPRHARARPGVPRGRAAASAPRITCQPGAAARKPLDGACGSRWRLCMGASRWRGCCVGVERTWIC